MTQLEQSFTIHPMGQGLFYSGKMCINDIVRFRMVFDCGSITAGAGEEEVDLYRDRDYLDTKILDLLVISHFHQDHVNHIKKLLAPDIKVRKLIMPFITFEERLFLILRSILNTEELPPDADTKGLTLNPLDFLADHLDENSEIILISSEDNSIPETPESDSPIDPNDIDTEERLIYDFEGQGEILNNTELSTTLLGNSNGKVYKVKDDKKGIVKLANSSIPLMEFLFYRSKIDNYEQRFYKLLKEYFDNKNQLNSETESYISNVVNIVKEFSSSTQAKELFDGFFVDESYINLKKELNLKISKSNLKSMNTTALSMLHKNLKGIYSFSSIARPERYPIAFSNIKQIQKFITNPPGRIQNSSCHIRSYHLHRRRDNIFPNTLLTSDIFLIKEDQVIKFMKKFKFHWNQFWLFQIPHHGSRENSNKLLHSNIPVRSSIFINYGACNNREDHPSQELIHDLTSTGNASELIAINEYTGLIFNLKL